MCLSCVLVLFFMMLLLCCLLYVFLFLLFRLSSFLKTFRLASSTRPSTGPAPLEKQKASKQVSRTNQKQHTQASIKHNVSQKTNTCLLRFLCLYCVCVSFFVVASALFQLFCLCSFLQTSRLASTILGGIFLPSTICMGDRL